MLTIIENIEFPADATPTRSRGTSYPLADTPINGGFRVPKDKALSFKSLLSRYRSTNPTAQFITAIEADGTLIVKRIA